MNGDNKGLQAVTNAHPQNSYTSKALTQLKTRLYLHASNVNGSVSGISSLVI
jgi:hypothetical protein